MLNFWSSRNVATWIAAAALMATGAVPALTTSAAAQITTVDPNEVLDADLKGQTSSAPNDYVPPSVTNPTPVPDYQPPVNSTPQPIDPNSDLMTYSDPNAPVTTTNPNPVNNGTTTTSGIPATLPTSGSQTYKKDDLIGAAEGVFGKGAQGVAQMLQDLLAKQGEPNGYIVGREASGAFVVGLRYGSGRLFHKVEGERDVYWTGPSVGFDTGGNASRTFVLVYNLYDSQELYKRFPAGEGSAYVVGGLTASYMRSGDVVLIPIRMGVGLRLGVNAGYMKFTEKRKWLPF